MFYEGYLPFDSSGDWFYQAVEMTSLALCVVTIYLALNMEQPYMFVEDGFGNFKHIPSQLGPVGKSDKLTF